MSGSQGLFVEDTKGLSMVAVEWRAGTLASEEWPGLVSRLSLPNELSRVASWTVVSLRVVTFTSPTSTPKQPG